MQDLAQRVGRYIREQELLRAGDRVGVAVSGGVDSVALLWLLLELREEMGVVLSAVHVNHQIRGAEADADQQFVAELAQQQGLPLQAFSVETPRHAAEHRLSLEAAARELRYRQFHRLLAEGTVDKVATAHTLDDQAETVLLRLARGTGIKGLASIRPKWAVGIGQWPEKTVAHMGASKTREGAGLGPAQGERSSPLPAIVRPLLEIRRGELESYLRRLGQAWREDASNLDLRFARNRVRHKILPLLETDLNPNIREQLAEIAEIARGEEEYWSAQLSQALPEVWAAPAQGSQPCLRIDLLQAHPLALQRRLVRAAAKSLGLSLEFQHVEELLALAQAPPAGEKRIMLPGGYSVLRRRGRLEFEPPSEEQAPSNHDFTYSVPCPGQVAVAETGTVFRATVGPISAKNLGQAYDPARLPSLLQVRNWRPGDRFWPNHTRAPKKVKELLQERKIPPAERRTWPVVTIANSGQEQVIWLRGFAPPEQWLAVSGQEQGVVIEECALQEVSHRAE